MPSQTPTIGRRVLLSAAGLAGAAAAVGTGGRAVASATTFVHPGMLHNDALGFGTLPFTQDRATSAAASASPGPASSSQPAHVNPAGSARPSSALGSAIPPLQRSEGAGESAGPFDLASGASGEARVGAWAGLAGGVALTSAGASLLGLRMRRARTRRSDGPTS